jgi:predicted outer membrane lipoprotein
VISAWLATISEPDLADWITVMGYLLAAALAVRAASRAKLMRERQEAWFWGAAAVALCLLSVNELLDMQTLLTIVVRDHAKAHGWYGAHRNLQHAFVVGLLLASALGAIAMLWVARRAKAMVRLALVGFIFICAFIVLRAASFHHADEILGSGLRSFNLGSIQEAIGILIVAFAAIKYPHLRRRG